jgi:hypothetical protein
MQIDACLCLASLLGYPHSGRNLAKAKVRRRKTPASRVSSAAFRNSHAQSLAGIRRPIRIPAPLRVFLGLQQPRSRSTALRVPTVRMSLDWRQIC